MICPLAANNTDNTTGGREKMKSFIITTVFGGEKIEKIFLPTTLEGG